MLAGSADFFLSELIIGAVGLIPGAGNIFPALCVRVQQLYEEGNLKEAITLQRKIVEADDALCRWYGIPGTKAYIASTLGYGQGVCRTPLQKASSNMLTEIKDVVDQVFALEKTCI